MGRSRVKVTCVEHTPQPGDTPFRAAERYWKSRTSSPDYSLALNPEDIVWAPLDLNLKDSLRGYWINRVTGQKVECLKVALDSKGLVGESMGQSRWKGKGKETGEENYCIAFPSIPGLILLPSILPPPIQRSLTVESFRHSIHPNLTSLSAHYNCPPDGLWKVWEEGKGDQLVERIDGGRGAEAKEPRKQVDLAPVTQENWKERAGQKEEIKQVAEVLVVKEEEKVNVGDLIKRLRWTTIGWSYNWTTKTYDFDKGRTALPPLIHETCRDAVRSVPFINVMPKAFGDVLSKKYQGWSDNYEPEAGIINHYQLKDSLTAHVDQSELDAIQPLISFSIGHSAIFLVGGQTRDVEPLAIMLESGDGLIMCGLEGRRVFHGLPRVIEGSLPSYLSSCIDHEDAALPANEWKLFGEYLEQGARLNINVRTVF